MQAQAQTFGPQNHAAFRKSYRYHNPIVLSPEQAADLAVLSAWNGIEAEMENAAPTANPYRKPLTLLSGPVPMQSAYAPEISSFWDPIIPSLDIPSLPPLTDAVDTLSLIETKIDLMKGRAVSPSSKANLLDAWLEGQASWGEVVKAHQPKATYTQHLVRRAYAVLSFVGGYARLR